MCKLQSVGVVMRSPATVKQRGRGWRMEEEEEEGGGGRNTMHDLLVWHYWAIPHREERKMEG